MNWYIIEYTIRQVWKHKTVQADDIDSVKRKVPKSARNVRIWKTL